MQFPRLNPRYPKRSKGSPELAQIWSIGDSSLRLGRTYRAITELF